ncbi:MAG: hypothetical protein EXQ47_04350 [Bryobacterales bacterium]|nr:hypothetical protein [Bryobacterales bacterium]
MGKINLGGVILGGLAAGLVANVLGFLVDGVILAPQWAEAMKALGRPDFSSTQIIGFSVLGFAYGIFTVWLYAAIRPRYGAGPKTAVCAGLAVWVAGLLIPNFALMGVTGLFPSSLTVMTTLGGIVEGVAGALAGAALYKESAVSAQSKAARA